MHAEPASLKRLHEPRAGEGMNRDPIRAIAENVVRIRYQDLPQDAVEGSKKGILDALGTTIAGSTAPGVAAVLALLKDWGGKKESSVAIFGHRIPAYHAVLANVMMCHALEIDDSHFPSIVHATSPTLWAGLATAEKLGGVSGRDLVAAVVLGIDAMARIGQAAPKTIDNGYTAGAVYAGFGAAVTAGKLLGLDSDVLVHALGITFARAAASVQSANDGALVKRLQPAFNASAGVKATEYARAGITGIQNILEGQFGIGRLLNHAPIDRAPLLDRLGSYFLTSELTTKRYPTSRCSHAPVEGTIALVRENDIAPEEIDEVIVAVQQSCYRRESAPFDPNEGTAQVKAQFSIDYCVAAAIIWREVFIDQVQDRAIFDPRILGLTRKIKVVENRENVGASQYLPARVTIRLRGGRTYSTEVTRLHGSPEDPLSWDEIIDERFKRCVQYSARPVSARRVLALVDMCRKLEDVPDVRELVRTLAVRQPSGAKRLLSSDA